MQLRHVLVHHVHVLHRLSHGPAQFLRHALGRSRCRLDQRNVYAGVGTDPCNRDLRRSLKFSLPAIVLLLRRHLLLLHRHLVLHLLLGNLSFHLLELHIGLDLVLVHLRVQLGLHLRRLLICLHPHLIALG
ncbi:MAG: hypothetical protein JW395_3640 [Nitrospira sp.]|nr:hypothetical protein [Nitrospira sp.]